MTPPAGTVSILMYHSVAIGPRPLAIEPQTFRMQLDMLERCGFRGISLRGYIESFAAARTESERVAVLTFDDGYGDFAEVAFPEIESRGWSCTVFLPSGLIGSQDGWDPDGNGRRPLIDWRQAQDLARRGAEIGAHGVSHTDLTTLTTDLARAEIVTSKEVIEQRIAGSVTSFAAPYGHASPALRQEIARHYVSAVGTRMALATPESERYDLPRIDMWYFRSPRRWQSFLEGSTGYFSARRALRRLRSIATSR